ncbi:flavin reductase family protein [Pseudogemmobacter bohemicus]|uniref:flavin reductase family protein n=1 Tax=Pseudogemmobacter bohemicus TaxID=2250708 RepID=UPI0018E55FB1|nr:flavin reductase family protein [Pseudogemmobacter bohemicus]
MHFDLDSTGPGIAYKLLVATVMPRPIAWVVTKSAAGIVNLAPFSFFNVMGDEPPTVVLGISPGRDGGLKHSAQNILDSGEFVVNLVPFALAGAMNLTSIDAPAGVSEAELAGLDLTPSAKVAPPRVTASPVALECRLSHRLDTGPRQMLLVGEVLSIHIEDRFVLNAARGHVDTPGLDLVGRSFGADYVRTGEVFSLERPLWRDYTPKDRA